MSSSSGSDPDTLDFHLIVNSLQDRPELGFVAAVVHAPVERWGTAFHPLTGCEQLMNELKDDGFLVELDLRGHMRARWQRNAVEAGPGATASADAGAAQSQVRSVRQTRYRLFRFLFPNRSDIYQLLVLSCERAKRENKTLRIKLELPPALSNLPWEMMRCPPDYPWVPVMMQARLAIVRYLCETEAMAPDHADADVPVILLVRADPIDAEYHDDDLLQSFDNEWEKLKAVFRRHSVSCEVIEGPDTQGQLVDRVHRFGQRIVGLHFIGHGDCDDEGGFLVVEDRDRAWKPLYFDDLRLALDRASGLRWIFLNACSTGYTPAGCPLSGLATTLSVTNNVPIVVAYTRPVVTNEAEMIAPSFYQLMLDERRGIDVAVRDLMLRQDADSSGLVVLARMVSGKMQTTFVLPTPVVDPSRSGPTPTYGAAHDGREAANVAAATLARPSAARPGPPAGVGTESRHGAVEPDAETHGAHGQAPMVMVPGGSFRRGLADSQIDEVLAQFSKAGFTLEPASTRRTLSQERCEEVNVPSFEIDETPVTNAQFREFALATRWVTEAERRSLPQTWRTYEHLEEHPVVCVSYDDALKFCEWTGKRLPTADEWKKAFRGTDSRLYPWGDSFDEARCNTAESQRGWETTPVRMFPEGRSPYGCYDMVGNVEEWTASALDEDRRIVLGGSWCMTCQVYGLPVLHRLAPRSFVSNEVGFRCAKSVAV